MSLKIVTRNVDKNGLTSVYVQYSYAGRSKRFPTNVKVNPSGWENGEIVKCAGAIWKEHNATLASRTSDITSVYVMLEKLVRRYTEDVHVAPTPEVLEELYQAPKLATTASVEKLTFWQHYNRLFIELEEKAKRGTARENTIRGWKALKTRLEDFEKAQGIRLSFTAFDYNILNSFNEFLQREGYRNSTIRTRIAKLKSILNHMVKIGLTKNVAWMYASPFGKPMVSRG